MRKAFAEMVVLVVIILSIFAFTATQRFILDEGGQTATKGIIFTKTINLKEYRVLGEGSGLLGTYKVYTRSIIQGAGEQMNVYDKGLIK